MFSEKTMATQLQETKEKKDDPSVCDACHIGQALGKVHCPLRQTLGWLKRRLDPWTEKVVEGRQDGKRVD